MSRLSGSFSFALLPLSLLHRQKEVLLLHFMNGRGALPTGNINSRRSGKLNDKATSFLLIFCCSLLTQNRPSAKLHVLSLLAILQWGERLPK